jgi:hypothetical protein
MVHKTKGIIPLARFYFAAYFYLLHASRLQPHQLKPLRQRVGQHIRQRLNPLQCHVVREREVVEVGLGDHFGPDEGDTARVENRVLLVRIAVDDYQHHHDVLLRQAADGVLQLLAVVGVDASVGDHEADLQHCGI